MRLARPCAAIRTTIVTAIGATLTIPGLAGAGDPRLDFALQPATVVVLESGGRRDALLTIDASNPGDRRVRVARVRATYFEGDRPVGRLDPATVVFTRAGLLSDPRIEGGSRDRWEALCLEPPTTGTDRVRFEFELEEHRGLHKARATQLLDVPLAAPVAPPLLSLPVSGIWRVTQGHACTTQHRRGRLGGEFAWDLAAVSESGRSGNPGFEASHRNGESATFGRPVVAPAGGTVVFAADGVEDNDEQRDFPRRSLLEAAKAPRWIFGNHVVLDAGGVFVLIAHLKKGSIVVKPGDAVREGAMLGRAGNSGNTMLPHVHIQVMNGADPTDPAVSGIPALFRNYIEVSSSGDSKTSDAVVRRVAAGDPPEGSVILTPDALTH